MKCSVCNHENLPGACFCAKCGASLMSENNQQVLVKQRKKEKSGTKTNIKAKFFKALQVLIYLVLAAGTVAFFFFIKGVKVQSSFDEDTYGQFTMFEVIVNLLTGGQKYNPTVFTIIMGMSSLLLMASSVIGWVAAFLTAILKKGQKQSYFFAMMFTSLNLIVTALLVPMSYRFSKIFKQICAREANMLVDDVKSISSIWAYVFVGVCVALIVIRCVLKSKEKKERC